MPPPVHTAAGIVSSVQQQQQQHIAAPAPPVLFNLAADEETRIIVDPAGQVCACSQRVWLGSLAVVASLHRRLGTD
jgi:hypothetical protein